MDACALYRAMLDGRVSDLELGGILLSMRIKGESVDEIAGFLDAAEASFAPLQAPGGQYAPIVIPSYNGARKMANLTALLALLLARAGAPVLVHGVTLDPGRVTTAEVLAALGVPACDSHAQAQDAMARGEVAFMPIATAGAEAGPYAVAAPRIGRAQFHPYPGENHAAVCGPGAAPGVVHAPGIPGNAR